MKGERRVSSLPTIIFQRRSERLDWRRIASLDIEKLIQDGDADLLEEFITPILFCKADSEFDLDRTDPGFIKVFQLCQLIGEYLQFLGEKEKEKVTVFETKCTELEEAKVRLVEEIANLKESLSGAKKELKKRTELLASTQNEVLGSNNHDEYDQCSYCPKRFLTPTYLLAHIQRRHQGLPLPMHLLGSSSFPSQHSVLQYPTGFSPKIVSATQGTSAAATVYAFTTSNMSPSPNGNVTRTRMENSTGANNTNTNLINPNIMPEYFIQNQNLQQQHPQFLQQHLLLQRRDSSTQTLITEPEGEGEILLMEHLGNSARSEGEMGSCYGTSNENDQNGNNILTPTLRPGSETSVLQEQVQPPFQIAGGSSLSPEVVSKAVEEVLTTVIKSPRQGVHGKTTNEKSNDFHVSRVDLNSICELVEKYLEQKSIVGQNQHYDKILSSIHHHREQHRGNLEGKNDGDDYDDEDGSCYDYDDTTRRNKVSKVVSNRNAMMGMSPSPPTTTIKGSMRNTNDKEESNLLLLDEAERNVMRLKDEFETRWGNLSEKVRDSGIEELKGAFLTEIKKVQEIIQKSPRVSRAEASREIGTRQQNRREQIDEEGEVKNDLDDLAVLNGKDSTDRRPSSGMEREEMKMVEERFQKQEELLEELTKSLQAKMQGDLDSLKNQLESQETFWRSKLQSVELEHEKQTSKLREDLLLQQQRDANNMGKKDKSNSDEQEVNHASSSPVLKLPPLPPSLNRTVEKASIGIQINPDEPEGPNNTIETSSTNALKHLPVPSQQNEIYSGPSSSYSSEYTSHHHPHHYDDNQEEDEFNPNSSNALPVSKPMPIAKPRKTLSKVCESHGIQMTDGNIHPRIVNGNANRENPGGRMMREINQPIQVSQHHQYRNSHREIIPTDSLEEDQEYLTVIQLEGNHTASITAAGKSPITTATPSSHKVVGGGGAGEGPQIHHEYEEPNHVRNLDQVSDYTLSEVRSADVECCSSGSESSPGTSEEEEEEKIHKEKNKSSVKKRTKYIFDEKKGKLVEVWGNVTDFVQGDKPKTQMDLVREKTVHEIDKHMVEMGINPEASTIGMEEMARALKHLKVNRRSIDQDPEQFDVERNEIKQDVNYEVAKRSIHQKLEKYGNQAGKKQPGASSLSKMFNKVKKSGTTWKKKVASAITRKQKSPTKGKLETNEDKTSTFWKSRWGRKMDKKPEGVQSKSQIEQENSSTSSEDEESAVDIEMPPFMTRSQPIILNDKENPKSSKRRSKTISSAEEEESDEGSFYEEDKTKKQSLNQQQLQGQMIKELKAKQSNRNKNSEKISTMPSASPEEKQMKPEMAYKVPNFFVNGSPVKTPTAINNPNSSMGNRTGQHQSQINYPVQVTSNGWSNTNTNTNVTRNKPISNNVSKENTVGGSSGKKKPFRRDLLEEFQQAEENTGGKTDDQNARRKHPGNFHQGKNRNHEMEKVVEEFQVEKGRKSFDSSDAECTSFENEQRPGGDTTTGVGNRMYVDVKYRSKNPGVSNTAFTREDGSRKGFRSRRTSSVSHSESGDDDDFIGRGGIRRKPLEEKVHYASLRHSDIATTRRPTTAPRVLQRSPSTTPRPHLRSHSRGRKGQGNLRQQRSPESDHTLHSSDTSVWETEEEESVGDHQMQKGQGRGDISRSRFSDEREDDRYMTSGRSHLKNPNFLQRNDHHLKPSNSAMQTSKKPSNGGPLSRRSPLNNSWDSD